MVTEFKSLIELNDYFKEEKTCIEFLAKQIWKDGQPVCPHCGSTKVYTTKSRSTKPSKKDVPEYRCADKACTKKFSATTGTIFESSKIPLRTWYAAIFILTTSKKGISSIQLSVQLGISQKTAWFVNHRIREMFRETAPHMLSGIIEADETYVGGKNGNRHQNKKYDYTKGDDEKMTVLGLVERGGRAMTFIVPNAKAEILQPIIQERVEQGSVVITDSLNSYTGLNETFQHVTVKHEKGSYRTDRHYHTNNIENLWSTLKKGIVGVYQFVSPQHVHRYTTEFTYRYNNRQDSGSEKFTLTVQNSNDRRLLYSTLINSPKIEKNLVRKKVGELKRKKKALPMPKKKSMQEMEDATLKYLEMLGKEFGINDMISPKRMGWGDGTFDDELENLQF